MNNFEIFRNILQQRKHDNIHFSENCQGARQEFSENRCGIHHSRCLFFSRKLDKCRKKEILNSSRDNFSSEKEATGVVDTASILTEFLTCALAVFGKVNIIIFSLL